MWTANEVSHLVIISQAIGTAMSTLRNTRYSVRCESSPDDIARMILFLLDEANDFITGQNFVVDGGMTRKMMYVY